MSVVVIAATLGRSIASVSTIRSPYSASGPAGPTARTRTPIPQYGGVNPSFTVAATPARASANNRRIRATNSAGPAISSDRDGEGSSINSRMAMTVSDIFPEWTSPHTPSPLSWRGEPTEEVISAFHGMHHAETGWTHQTSRGPWPFATVGTV